jgi:hypothetical protein
MPKLAVLGRPVRVLRVTRNYKTNRAVMLRDYGHTSSMTEVMRRESLSWSALSEQSSARPRRSPGG